MAIPFEMARWILKDKQRFPKGRDYLSYALILCTLQQQAIKKQAPWIRGLSKWLMETTYIQYCLST